MLSLADEGSIVFVYTGQRIIAYYNIKRISIRSMMSIEQTLDRITTSSGTGIFSSYSNMVHIP